VEVDVSAAHAFVKPAAAALRFGREKMPAQGARTIVVQDGMSPYLTGASTTSCRDFHKVFHSFCGSIPEQPIQRR
jgi:hypothetical protein